MDQIEAIVAREFVISTAEYPGLAVTIRRRARAGLLAAVLPGVYAAADRATDFHTRVRAVAARTPAAVITGDAAARLTFQPDRRVSVIDVAGLSRPPVRAWLRASRRGVPADHVVMLGPVRLTEPALTAVELAARDGGDAIDAALRAGAVTQARLTEALDACAGRTGARTRRQVVARSRSNPWSPAERRLHELLDQAGITGWSANRPAPDRGRIVVPDVYLAGGVVLEVDGRAYPK